MKVALVTGANTGIGLAIAHRLLDDGFALGYATQGDDDRHKGPLDELRAKGDVAWGHGNPVAPGVIATPRNEKDAESLNPEVPLGRPGKPEEVAALVSWLVSNEAAYVTGSSYVMDGGMIQQVVNVPA